jgi:hypothetical protein
MAALYPENAHQGLDLLITVYDLLKTTTWTYSKKVLIYFAVEDVSKEYGLQQLRQEVFRQFPEDIKEACEQMALKMDQLCQSVKTYEEFKKEKLQFLMQHAEINKALNEMEKKSAYTAARIAKICIHMIPTTQFPQHIDALF